jgi:ornithine cyclodeaminase/alanine dehydrogenase-like protein (mu-crystallin family)
MDHQPPLLHLGSSDVEAAMPPMTDRLALAERALRSLAGDAQLPAKIGVQPRPQASWAHAMPAWVPGAADDGSHDLLGVKFVSGFPDNARRGMPALHATLLMCDPVTGRPIAIMDAGPITAARTAAVSGVAVATWGPGTDGPTVALVGGGVQARAHVEVLRTVLPGSHLRIHDRHQERAEHVARQALDSGSFASVTTEPTVEGAVRGADIVITMVSFGPHRQGLPADVFGDASLVVTVDYDMCLPAAVARDAALFLVDEAGQFEANRAKGLFTGYPAVGAMMGERLDGPRPAGRIVVVHLGTGVADLVFGDAILRAAEARGLGTLLPG